MTHEKSLLSLSVQHSIAFNVRKVTHVTLLSERVVVVEASLTGPVTNGILLFHPVLLGHLVVKLLIEFRSWLVVAVFSGNLCFCFFVFHLSDVFRLAFIIL